MLRFFLGTIALELAIECLVLCRFKGIAKSGMVSNEMVRIGGEDKLPAEGGFIGPAGDVCGSAGQQKQSIASVRGLAIGGGFCQLKIQNNESFCSGARLLGSHDFASSGIFKPSQAI